MSGVGVFSSESCFLSPHIIRDCTRCEFYKKCVGKLEAETGVHRVWFDDGNGLYLEEPVEVVLRKQEIRLGKEEADRRLTYLFGKTDSRMVILLAFNRNGHMSAKDIEDLGIMKATSAWKIFRDLSKLGYIVRVEHQLKYPHYWKLNI